jgi:microsomal dipeptidase-like Zn-dependent dipeptidase
MTIIKKIFSLASLLSLFILTSCSEDPVALKIDFSVKNFHVANGCFIIQSKSLTFTKNSNTYHFSDISKNNATPFIFIPTDLGEYLIYDSTNNYLIAKNTSIQSVDSIESETTNPTSLEDEFKLTEGEWSLQSTSQDGVYLLFNLYTQGWLSSKNTITKNPSLAAPITLSKAVNCATFPESHINVEGEISQTQFPDGTLWGIVDAHEHIMPNVSGPQSFSHGHAFHKLGITHALHDCSKHHGTNGSRDIMSIAFTQGGADISTEELFVKLIEHLGFNKPLYNTSGFPSFADWPKFNSVTHQQMYFKWIERAYLGGLRLMVDYTVSPEVQCGLLKTLTPNETGERNCNEMEGVDRHFKRIKHMERYIDAHHGGPGKGWFRIVYSPEEARSVISQGKLAIILGIEIENPFNCFRNPRKGTEPCTKEYVQQRLDHYYKKGLRALFPVHKFSNAFGTGDGTAGILELGDFLNTNGEWRDYVSCDEFSDAPALGNFEGGKSLFTDIVSFPSNGVFSFLSSLQISSPLPFYVNSEKHCQREGLTDLGKFLMKEMMKKGMIIDLGHLSTAGYIDAYSIFKEYQYPPVDTHGGDYGGQLFKLGGFVNANLAHNCDTSRTAEQYLSFYQKAIQFGHPYPTMGIGIDFNGAATYTAPRFGAQTSCETNQNNPLTYPFTSFDPAIKLNKLQTGSRTFDFNTDGLAHIGLLPDMIQDLRNNGLSDDQLAPLFKSAEGYIRMWETMIERSKAIQSMSE